MDYVISICFGLVFVLAIALEKGYRDLPTTELQRRARTGQKHGSALHSVSAFGTSFQRALWIVAAVGAAGFVLALQDAAGRLLGLVIAVAAVWFALQWLASARTSRTSVQLAVALAPFVRPIVAALHPVLSWRAPRLHVRTGLWEKADLLKLLRTQAKQADNRIAKQELHIAEQALLFADKRVGDVMTPRRMVKTIAPDESLGPVVLDELHKSGFSRFPVTSDGKEFVGVLLLRDAISRSTASVKSRMQPGVLLANEDDTLHAALQTMLREHHHLLIVVNEFKEFVGVLSLEDVLEQILGQNIVDESDQHEDLRAEATKQAHKSK